MTRLLFPDGSAACAARQYTRLHLLLAGAPARAVWLYGTCRLAVCCLRCLHVALWLYAACATCCLRCMLRVLLACHIWLCFVSCAVCCLQVPAPMLPGNYESSNLACVIGADLRSVVVQVCSLCAHCVQTMQNVCEVRANCDQNVRTPSSVCSLCLTRTVYPALDSQLPDCCNATTDEMEVAMHLNMKTRPRHD
jgi:hypothetical protein